MAKVSIQIPVYNGEKYLRQTLASVLDNSPEDVEVFVTDNGSSDNSIDIISEFARRDSRIRFERYTQGRLSRAYMVEQTHADYIIPFDHDDIFMPGRIERHIKMLESSPDIIGVYGKTAYLNMKDLSIGFYQGQSFNHFQSFYVSNPIGNGAMTMRREPVLEVGNYTPPFIDPETGKGEGAGDRYLWQRLASKGSFHFENEFTYIYRLHPINSSPDIIPERKESNKTTKEYIAHNFYTAHKDRINSISRGENVSFLPSEYLLLVQIAGFIYNQMKTDKLQIKTNLLQLAASVAPADPGVLLSQYDFMMKHKNYATALKVLELIERCYTHDMNILANALHKKIIVLNNIGESAKATALKSRLDDVIIQARAITPLVKELAGKYM